MRRTPVRASGERVELIEKTRDLIAKPRSCQIMFARMCGDDHGPASAAF
jgi:hypothetical protein